MSFYYTLAPVTPGVDGETRRRWRVEVFRPLLIIRPITVPLFPPAAGKNHDLACQ
jgi:hypothetical protein